MRCADCQTEPLSPARYCECCGREIALHQDQAEEADPVSGADDWAPNPNPTSDLRYQAPLAPFSNSETDPATAASNDVASSAADQPVAQTVSPASTLSPSSSQEPSELTTVETAATPQALPDESTTPVKDNVAVAKTKAVEPEAVKTREASPTHAKADPVHAENARRPPVTRRPTVPANVPILNERQNYSTAVAIAALVVGVLVVGAPWIRIYKDSAVARVKQLVSVVAKNKVTEVADAADHSLPIEPPPAVSVATPVRDSAVPKERPAVPTAPTQERKPTTAAVPVASAPSRPKPVTPVPPARPAAVKTVVNKPVKAIVNTPVKVKEPPREVAPVPVLAAKPSAPVIAVPVVEVVAAAPTPAAPVPAVGPFFESNQVNESPRVVTRAEPRLPDALRDRSIKEVVVVRALVSQSGHPSRVSLLRRSKAGPQLDDVVVAAVNQWTFSPARKKGEAVSCWFNFAVPIGE